MNGDIETGVSFIEISKNKFDAGRILHQSRTSIEATDRYLELSEKLSLSAADGIEHLLRNLTQLRADSLPQDDSLMTTASKISPSEVVADFSNHHATHIMNQYRGLYGTN